MRPTYFAGSFYPEQTHELYFEIETFIKKVRLVGNAGIAGICPHAGHIYSGRLALQTLINLKDINYKKTTVIFVGPSHTGMGYDVNLSIEDWETPLGIVEYDEEIGKTILENSNVLRVSEAGHYKEHSIEVQLPFLKYLNKNAKMVAISMLNQEQENWLDLGNAIAKTVRQYENTGKNILVVASSDFTHFLDAETSEKLNKKAIEKIKSMDVFGFYNLIKEMDLSVCGYGPISVVMTYAKKMGVKKANLLEYADSSAINFDKQSVVGYASIIFQKQNEFKKEWREKEG